MTSFCEHIVPCLCSWTISPRLSYRRCFFFSNAFHIDASFSPFLKFLLLTYFQWSLFLPCEITSSNLVAKREDLSDLPFSPFSLAQDIKISRANIWGKHLKISTNRLAQAWTKIQIWAAAAPWYRISLLLHLMTLLQALWMTKTCLPN